MKHISDIENKGYRYVTFSTFQIGVLLGLMASNIPENDGYQKVFFGLSSMLAILGMLAVFIGIGWIVSETLLPAKLKEPDLEKLLCFEYYNTKTPRNSHYAKIEFIDQSAKCMAKNSEVAKRKVAALKHGINASFVGYLAMIVALIVSALARVGQFLT